MLLFQIFAFSLVSFAFVKGVGLYCHACLFLVVIFFWLFICVLCFYRFAILRRPYSTILEICMEWVPAEEGLHRSALWLAAIYCSWFYRTVKYTFSVWLSMSKLCVCHIVTWISYACYAHVIVYVFYHW